MGGIGAAGVVSYHLVHQRYAAVIISHIIIEMDKIIDKDIGHANDIPFRREILRVFCPDVVYVAVNRFIAFCIACIAPYIFRWFDLVSFETSACLPAGRRF